MGILGAIDPIASTNKVSPILPTQMNKPSMREKTKRRQVSDNQESRPVGKPIKLESAQAASSS